MPQTFYKDPDNVLDYKVDWSDWLAESSPVDTIATSTWFVPSGITKDSESNDTSSATIWISGGTDQRNYTAINRVTTAGGRTKDERIYIRVREG